MQFLKTGDIYRAVRITGPTHNLLGLQLSASVSASPVSVEVIGGNGSTPRTPVDVVRAKVLEGVERANKRLGTTWCVTRIQFVFDDSPDPEAYVFLAESIVTRIANGEEFTVVGEG